MSTDSNEAAEEKPHVHHTDKKSKAAEDADILEHVFYIPSKDHPEKLVKVPIHEDRFKKYLEMFKPELQEYLRFNGQLVTGRKLDLLLRCFDGEMNGRIPGCDYCHHGQMKYDYQDGKFVCNGYFDEVAQHPVHCGHVADNVKREKWRDPKKDSPITKGEHPKQQFGDVKHHKNNVEHHHGIHHCIVEANHPLVDLLEDMAYYHTILKDEKWSYKARAFISAARAVEHLPFEVTDALSLGSRKDVEHHVQRIGKGSADVMQAFLDSGKKRSPHLEELKKLAFEKLKSEEHGSKIEVKDVEKKEDNKKEDNGTRE